MPVFKLAKVAIVGAAPAGLTAAMVLRNQGFRPAGNGLGLSPYNCA